MVDKNNKMVSYHFTSSPLHPCTSYDVTSLKSCIQYYISPVVTLLYTLPINEPFVLFIILLLVRVTVILTGHTNTTSKITVLQKNLNFNSVLLNIAMILDKQSAGQQNTVTDNTTISFIRQYHVMKWNHISTLSWSSECHSEIIVDLSIIMLRCYVSIWVKPADNLTRPTDRCLISKSPMNILDFYGYHHNSSTRALIKNWRKYSTLRFSRNKSQK